MTQAHAPYANGPARTKRDGPPGTAVSTPLARLAQAIREYLQRRRARPHREHLESLPDYLIADVGLTRAQLRNRTGHPFA